MSSYRESATPIFDEVDRRWRKSDDDPDVEGAATPSMLSFTGTPAPARPAPTRITAARREPGPRHAVRS